MTFARISVQRWTGERRELPVTPEALAESIEFFLDGGGFNLSIIPTEDGQSGPWMQIAAFGRNRDQLGVYVYNKGNLQTMHSPSQEPTTST